MYGHLNPIPETRRIGRVEEGLSLEGCVETPARSANCSANINVQSEEQSEMSPSLNQSPRYESSGGAVSRRRSSRAGSDDSVLEVDISGSVQVPEVSLEPRHAFGDRHAHPVVDDVLADSPGA